MAVISKLTNLASSGVRYLFIGNPGVGKSTILNGLVGLPVFKSGISYGKGMTFRFDKHVEGNNTYYMDTPGLADPEMRKQAAAAIAEALKQNGFYKIFFVVCLQNGRVKAEDVTTMKLVLDAAPITNYGIIINQVPPRQYADLTANPQAKSPSPYQEVCSSLEQSILSCQQCLRIHVMKRDPDLEDAADMVKILPPDLRSFIHEMPGMRIQLQNVNPVVAGTSPDLARLRRETEGAEQERREKERLVEERRREQERLRQQEEALRAERHRREAEERQRAELEMQRQRRLQEQRRRQEEERRQAQLREFERARQQELERRRQIEEEERRMRLAQLNRECEEMRRRERQMQVRIENSRRENDCSIL